MSGDYKTIEFNHPKILYLKNRSEINTEWLD